MGLILVINPGGGSTKIGLFDGEKCVLRRSLPHDKSLAIFEDLLAHRGDLENEIMAAVGGEGIEASSLDAIVGRGGALKPLESGTYRVNSLLADDIKQGNVQAKHASNLGALLAFELGERLGKPAFMVDPVSVDEFVPEARLSGLPELVRKSLDHPLNGKMVARKAAAELGRAYDEINAIVAHLGTGISVAAHRRGRMIDVSNANDGGPFSTQRAGGLPVTQLADLCYSGKYSRDEMYAKLTVNGGLRAYLGTDDVAQAEKMAASGDETASLVLKAMAYQIAKEIGAYATVLKGEVDAVIFTGGIAHSELIVGLVKERVRFITANIFVYPGEHELESLALGALRVLRGEEAARTYR
jgi:butyrate kinase